MTGFSDWNSGVFCLLTNENLCVFALPSQSALSNDKRRYTEKRSFAIFQRKCYIVRAIWKM